MSERKKTVVVFYGGQSSEHTISCISAAGVVKNFPLADYNLKLVAITKDGKFFLQADSLIKAAQNLKELPIARETGVLAKPGCGFFIDQGNKLEKLDCDIAFPVLHGQNGEDGTIQGLFELLGLAYIGCKVTGSALAMDKVLTKKIWKEAGLPVVPSIEVYGVQVTQHSNLGQQVANELGFPCFVKPVCAGSSVGASKVNKLEELAPAIIEACKFDERVLIEKYIPAREIECSVLGNSGDTLQSFGPGEIIPSHEFYDYEAKYLDPEGARLAIPALVDLDVQKKFLNLAIEAYRVLGLCGLARVDFFLDKKTNEIYLNEVNTLPGFTPISMYPKMCEYGGLAYSDLLKNLLELAIK